MSNPNLAPSTPCQSKSFCGDFCVGRCVCLGCMEPWTYACTTPEHKNQLTHPTPPSGEIKKPVIQRFQDVTEAVEGYGCDENEASWLTIMSYVSALEQRLSGLEGENIELEKYRDNPKSGWSDVIRLERENKTLIKRIYQYCDPLVVQKILAALS